VKGIRAVHGRGRDLSSFYAIGCPGFIIGGMDTSLGLTGQSRGSLVRVGGALGVAGCIVGLLVLVAGCAGFYAAYSFCLVPLTLGVVGLVLAIIGAVKSKDSPDTHVLGALFTTIVSVIGGVVELAAWMGWKVFY
jgi:hypothetical protein